MSSLIDEIKKDNARVVIFDTTLRDGEQSPGCSMNLDEKLKMAAILESMGVDVIEAGFPVASPGDFEAVSEIARRSKNSVIAGLCRAVQKDIDAAIEATKPAARSRIHTFISTSPLHMKYKLQKEPHEVLEAIEWSVAYARKHCDDIEWSAEDGSRTEPDFLCRAVETAIAAGATTINIPDTVGYAVPSEYGALIKMLFDRVPNINRAIISVHCHNDLGLAVANSLAGVEAGARQIECTINGIGERAGNAALEEVVMALRTRADRMPFTNKIETAHITNASRTLSAITGMPVQHNKAIVGANAFAHESGIHQDGMLKNAQTYEIMTPESVGMSHSNLVLGKHSGRHAFKKKLEGLGYALSDKDLDDAFARFKTLADRKKDVFDEDLVALVDTELAHAADRIRLVAMEVFSSTDAPQRAKLTLSVDGAQKTAELEGNGAVDAIFKAIAAIVPHEKAKLSLFNISAVTGGTDAQAEVTVRLEEDGKTVNGQGADTDTLVAAARAYVHALNKLMVKRARQRPEDQVTTKNRIASI
ncbi:MAG: 2-isopropylmalate synthase [Rhodospirillales bacterium]|nr:MAG: 2-isopropylmalate synthase [Rhodospirillales bacterium]